MSLGLPVLIAVPCFLLRTLVPFPYPVVFHACTCSSVADHTSIVCLSIYGLRSLFSLVPLTVL
jgi:hypothetical protein